MDAEDTNLCDRMLAEHRRFDERLVELVAAWDGGQPASASRLWSDFAKDLTAHLDIEDRFIVPALFRANPRGARAISEEHKHLRTRLKELNASVAAGALRVETLESFVEELRAHGRNEERLLYRWATAHMPESEQRAMLDAMPTGLG